jgi:hypothetical protein
MIRLVEVVLEPGKRPAHPLQRQPYCTVPELPLNPGYAVVEVSRGLHRLLVRELKS